MPSNKQTENSAQLSLRDATEWIENTRDQIYALSEASVLLMKQGRDERIERGLIGLWGSIDAQLVQAIGHIQEGRAAL